MQMVSQPVGIWSSSATTPAFRPDDVVEALHDVRTPLHIIRDGNGAVGVARGGKLIQAEQLNGVPSFHLLATLPAIYPEWLGDRSFTEVHGTRFPYVAGAMANGIATTDIVIEMAKAGMMGMFGAAGLTRPVVEAALDRLEAALGDRLPWGSNLIHSPNEPDLEMSIAELYIQRNVNRVSASAYMSLTEAIVRYAYTGLREDAYGNVLRDRFVFAKISRPEVARHFMSPAPKAMLDKLVAAGHLTAEEARLAQRVPVAEDYIIEADSGGHTDNRILTALFPTIAGLREEMQAKYGYTRPIRLGAAGGIGTPDAVASAFALGAAFVLTGSVNQGAIESGLDASGRKALATAGMADVMMAPAADMFELGVKVQVLRRGTLFGPRAHKLYELYTTYDGLEFIPAAEKARLEKDILGQSAEEVWQGTREFFLTRDPKEVARAERDPKHRMALVFRWYLGLSSRWAISGDPKRRMDYQIWCGPAMGAFNAWVKGSFMEPPEARTVVQIARNLLEGAAAITRAQQARTYGVAVPQQAFRYAPRPLDA